MADETTTTEPAPTATETAQPAPAQGERTFTQAEVDRIVQERLARAKSNGQPRPAAPPQQQAATATGKADVPDTAMLLADFQDNVDALSEELGVRVPPEFKKRIRSLYVSERPVEPNAWLKGWFEAAGLKKSETPPNQVQQSKGDQPVNGQKPATPPISNKGPASNATRDPEDVLLNDMGSFDSTVAERLTAKHGEDKANQMIAEAASRHMATIKLKPDRRR